MLKVNGKAYDWGDVDLKIPGLNIQVQEISYDDELEMEEVYGSGSKPRGYGTGNYKASGKLSMLRDDYDDLLAYCKQKGVPFYKMELPSIIVSYANEGARTKIDELKKVKFSKPVRVSYIWACSVTTPARAWTASGCRAGSRPSTVQPPPVGVSIPVRSFTVVVLPAPLGPRKPKISPGSRAMDTSRKAAFPPG